MIVITDTTILSWFLKLFVFKENNYIVWYDDNHPIAIHILFISVQFCDVLFVQWLVDDDSFVCDGYVFIDVLYCANINGAIDGAINVTKCEQIYFKIIGVFIYD